MKKWFFIILYTALILGAGYAIGLNILLSAEANNKLNYLIYKSFEKCT